MTDCAHPQTYPDIVDQTVGVICRDCGELVAVCWYDEHIPEDVWNRACLSDNDGHPRPTNRSNVCAICEEPIARNEGAPSKSQPASGD